MRFVDNTTPGAALNFFGAGKAGFQDGDPTTGIRGTEIDSNLWNDILGNLMGVLDAGAVAPTPGRFQDLADAIAALVALASGFTTGDVKVTMQTAAPAGWVMMSGRTIGDAASGATERANADTLALFTLLWNTFDNVRLPIQTSAGAASARGGSAADDFAANKRMPLIDGRDYTIVGKGDMGGAAAGRITAAVNGIDTTVLGTVGGTEAHSLTEDENGPHSHIYTHPNSNTSASGGGSPGSQSGDNTGSSGLGTAHPNVQPSLVLNFLVKL